MFGWKKDTLAFSAARDLSSAILGGPGGNEAPVCSLLKFDRNSQGKIKSTFVGSFNISDGLKKLKYGSSSVDGLEKACLISPTRIFRPLYYICI